MVLTGITVNSFIGNGPTPTTGYWFATDVLSANGNTGNIAAGPAVGINLLGDGSVPRTGVVDSPGQRPGGCGDEAPEEGALTARTSRPETNWGRRVDPPPPLF